MKYQIEVKGNAVKIEKLSEIAPKKTYITTIEHIVNLLNTEEFYKYETYLDYEKETDNN